MVILGGQETTAIANACTIFMLAHHQDVQNKVTILYIIKNMNYENVMWTFDKTKLITSLNSITEWGIAEFTIPNVLVYLVTSDTLLY
jgi:hypothetical protein